MRVRALILGVKAASLASMRVALCLVGEPRTFTMPHVAASIEQNLVGALRAQAQLVDVFALLRMTLSNNHEQDAVLTALTALRPRLIRLESSFSDDANILPSTGEHHVHEKFNESDATATGKFWHACNSRSSADKAAVPHRQCMTSHMAGAREADASGRKCRLPSFMNWPQFRNASLAAVYSACYHEMVAAERADAQQYAHVVVARPDAYWHAPHPPLCNDQSVRTLAAPCPAVAHEVPCRVTSGCNRELVLLDHHLVLPRPVAHVMLKLHEQYVGCWRTGGRLPKSGGIEPCMNEAWLWGNVLEIAKLDRVPTRRHFFPLALQRDPSHPMVRRDHYLCCNISRCLDGIATKGINVSSEEQKQDEAASIHEHDP